MSTNSIEDQELQEYHRIKGEGKCLQVVKDRINLVIPGLAARVFALRNIAYNGYGSHYSDMELCLGTLVSMVNDGDYPTTVRDIIQRRLVIEARYQELVQKIEKAEWG